MKTIIRISLGLVLALSATAAARTDGGGGGSTAPEPVPASDFRLVIKDVAILDGDGAELRRTHCEWTEPQEDDRPCLRFSGDPQAAYREIQDAGGSAATVDTRVPELELESHTSITRRGDGTWLFRTDGTEAGRTFRRGYVCSAEGRNCSRYEASSERRERRAIRAASARLKKRVRAGH